MVKVDPSDRPVGYDKATYRDKPRDFDTSDEEDLDGPDQEKYDKKTRELEEKRKKASDDPPKEEPGIIAQILSFFGGNGTVHDVCT